MHEVFVANTVTLITFMIREIGCKVRCASKPPMCKLVDASAFRVDLVTAPLKCEGALDRDQVYLGDFSRKAKLVYLVTQFGRYRERVALVLLVSILCCRLSLVAVIGDEDGIPPLASEVESGLDAWDGKRWRYDTAVVAVPESEVMDAVAELRRHIVK